MGDQLPSSGTKGSCAGCLGFVFLVFIVFLIAEFVGCEWTKTTTDSPTGERIGRSKDPSLRYIGSQGAVAGYNNNFGQTTRLEPGTTVRATGSSYVDPMAGPKRIYIVTEGALRGMQVPLSEAELEPQ